MHGQKPAHPAAWNATAPRATTAAGAHGLAAAVVTDRTLAQPPRLHCSGAINSLPPIYWR